MSILRDLEKSANLGQPFQYPLVMTNIAMENHYVEWENPLEMAIFSSYVKLPDGNSHQLNDISIKLMLGKLLEIQVIQILSVQDISIVDT